MTVCRYCERSECDTDCAFADTHTGTTRLTAAQWRQRGRDEVEAQHGEVRRILETNAREFWFLTPGAPLWEHVARLRERLRNDHEGRCGVVMANLRDARDRLAKLQELRAELDEVAATSVVLRTKYADTFENVTTGDLRAWIDAVDRLRDAVARRGPR